MFLYRLTFPNGKVYIGQTVKTVHIRVGHHRASAVSGSHLPVHAAWRKYGDPVIEVLGEYPSHDALNAAEIEAIALYQCLSPLGYNIALGGHDGTTKSPVVRAKIAAKATGRAKTAETVAKNAAASKAKWQDPEYRNKVSEGLCAAYTDEHRKAASERSKAMWAKRKADGWTMPESQRAKIKARVFSDQTRANMSAAAKGKPKAPCSDETRAKLASATKARWAIDREARSESIKAAHAARSPEERSAAAKLAWATKRGKGVA